MELSSFRKNWWSLVSDVLCFKNWASEANWFNYFWRPKGNSESKQSSFERDSKSTNRLISRSHVVAYNDYASAPEPLSNELPDREYESEPEYENQKQLKHHDDNNKQSKPDVVNEHEKPPSKFKTVSYGSAGWEQTRIWILQFFLKPKAILMMAGAPGDFKTFIALRICQCLANAAPVAECKVAQADVHYVAAEGSDGIKMRLRALEEAHGSVDERISFSFRSVDLRYSEDVDYLENVFVEHEERTGNKIGLLVLDTLSVNAIGLDENAAKDVARFIASCKQFADKHNIIIMIVHHFGKGGDIRGSIALKGNVDVVWRVNRVEKSIKLSSVLTVEKSRDGEAGIGLKFDLEAHDTGLKDQWNESVTTLRVIKEQFVRASQFVHPSDDKSQKPRKPTKAELDGEWLLAQLRKHNEPLRLAFLKDEFSKVEKLTEDALYQRIKRAKEYLQRINAIDVTNESKDVVLELRNLDENAFDEIDQDDDYLDEF